MSFSLGAFIVVNPICEETLVRAFLQTRLRQLGWPAPCSAAASALAQGAYHIYRGWPFAASVTLLMLVWAWFYERTRRLSPVIGAHLLADLSVLL